MIIIEDQIKNYDPYCIDRQAISPLVQGDCLHVYSGKDSDGGCSSYVILNDDDLTCVLIGYWFRLKKKSTGGGQFYRHYKNGAQVTWKELAEEDKLRILDQQLPEWARKPGKLKKDYLKPRYHQKVEKDNAGNIVAYKYLVWDELEQVFKSFSWYAARNCLWVDNSISADVIPAENNTNGIYAAKTPDSPILNTYSKHPHVKLVRLLLSGAVVEYSHGYRAEHADILEALS